MARYSTIYRLPESLYGENAPVMVEAGALLMDSQVGKFLAQLKMKNIGMATIQKVIVRIAVMDAEGKQTGAPVVAEYSEEKIPTDAYFGQKKPVYLPGEVARSFAVQVTDVFFTDGTSWKAQTDSNWTPMDAEYAQQLEQNAPARREAAQIQVQAQRLDKNMVKVKDYALMALAVVVVAAILYITAQAILYRNMPGMEMTPIILYGIGRSMFSWVLALVVPAITLVIAITKKVNTAKVMVFVIIGAIAIQLAAAIACTGVDLENPLYSVISKVSGYRLLANINMILGAFSLNMLLQAISEICFIVKNVLCLVGLLKVCKK